MYDVSRLYIIQIHQLFNEFEKEKVTYKCDRMEYQISILAAEEKNLIKK